MVFFFSSRRRHTRCALVTGVQTSALPICCASSFAQLAPLTSIITHLRGSTHSSRLRRMRVLSIRACCPGVSSPHSPKNGPTGNQSPHCLKKKAMRANSAHSSRSFRSEEHTSELQSLMRISYAVFCLKKKQQQSHKPHH